MLLNRLNAFILDPHRHSCVTLKSKLMPRHCKKSIEGRSRVSKIRFISLNLFKLADFYYRACLYFHWWNIRRHDQLIQLRGIWFFFSCHVMLLIRYHFLIRWTFISQSTFNLISNHMPVRLSISLAVQPYPTSRAFINYPTHDRTR